MRVLREQGYCLKGSLVDLGAFRSTQSGQFGGWSWGTLDMQLVRRAVQSGRRNGSEAGPGAVDLGPGALTDTYCRYGVVVFVGSGLWPVSTLPA
jgi:hypothetical protein